MRSYLLSQMSTTQRGTPTQYFNYLFPDLLSGEQHSRMWCRCFCFQENTSSDNTGCFVLLSCSQLDPKPRVPLASINRPRKHQAITLKTAFILPSAGYETSYAQSTLRKRSLKAHPLPFTIINKKIFSKGSKSPDAKLPE